MKLPLLKAIAPFFNSYKTLFDLRRIEDNLFRLTLDFDEFYIDVSKSRSLIFISDEKILGNPYCAPFDRALQKYCSRAELISCRLDGENRILVFEFLHSRSYKQERYFLYFELTGRHTNVVLVGAEGIIIEALRHISKEKSIRVIKPQKPYTSLPQPLHSSKMRALEILDLKSYLKEEYVHFRSQRVEQKKQTLLDQRTKKLRSLEQILHSLPKISDLEEKKHRYALYGEVIFASLHQLSFFQRELEVLDFEGRNIKIVFPEMIQSYAQGGNYFYAQSKKYKQKLENLWIQKENLESKIAFLQKEIAYIQTLESYQDLQVFSPIKKKLKKQIKRDYESFFIDGVKVSIGKNMRENQKLLQDAKADDLWLHIQDFPSSHMIIHCGKAKCKEEVLKQSAKILLGINGFLDKNIAVDYTQRRFVKIIEGANVFYSKQKTLKF